MRLYIADASPLADEEVYNRIYSLLPAFRREKADKYKGAMAKHLSVTAGYLLIKAFEDLQMGYMVEKIYEDSLGKPIIDGDIYFNLSHSGSKAICAISDTKLGADIQVMDRDNTSIASRFFSKDESDFVFAADNKEEIKKRFYQIWTMKEAYTKMTGEGIRRDFSKFSVLDSGLNFWNNSLDNYYISICAEVKISSVDFIDLALT